MKDHLKRRLRYLWTFELANAVIVFPLCGYALSVRYRLGWLSLAALLVVCAILLVGASFWYLKGRALAGSDRLARSGTRRFYRATKIAFGGVMGVLLVLFIVRIFGPDDAPRADLIAGGALTLLALLEYVNYYFVQLSYDNRADLQYLRTHRRLKRATMVRELDI